MGYEEKVVRVVMVAWRSDRGGGVGSRIGVYTVTVIVGGAQVKEDHGDNKQAPGCGGGGGDGVKV